jgi:hypothetical protein
MTKWNEHSIRSRTGFGSGAAPLPFWSVPVDG